MSFSLIKLAPESYVINLINNTDIQELICRTIVARRAKHVGTCVLQLVLVHVRCRCGRVS
jgi:hypothetical protein